MTHIIFQKAENFIHALATNSKNPLSIIFNCEPLRYCVIYPSQFGNLLEKYVQTIMLFREEKKYSLFRVYF